VQAFPPYRDPTTASGVFHRTCCASRDFSHGHAEGGRSTRLTSCRRRAINELRRACHFQFAHCCPVGILSDVERRLVKATRGLRVEKTVLACRCRLRCGRSRRRLRRLDARSVVAKSVLPAASVRHLAFDPGWLPRALHRGRKRADHADGLFSRTGMAGAKRASPADDAGRGER